MAKKINSKLLFVVGAGGVSVAAAVGFLWWRSQDTDRYVREGDTLSSKGDYKKAVETYGRAVSKKPNNIKYLEKYNEGLLKVVPETQSEATERYGQFVASLQNLARADRDNVDRWRKYLETVVEQCEAMPSVASWKSLSDRATDMLSIVRPEGVEAQVAKAYRGFAGVRRLDSLDEPQRLKVLEDLKTAAACKELTPTERDRVLGSIARIAVDDLARAKGAGRADRLEAATAAADAALAEAAAASPDGIVTATALLERAIVDANGSADAPEIKQRLSGVSVAAGKLDQPMAVYAALASMSRGGREGVMNAIELAKTFLEKHPEQLLHRRILASMYRYTDREAALVEVQKILDAPRPAVGLLSASFDGNRIAASLVRFDILFDAAQEAKGDARTAAIARLDAALADVKKALEGSSDPSSLIRAEGKLAASRGDFANAAVKYNEVFKRGSEVDLELYLLAAFANFQLGESGRSLDLVNGGLQLSPGNPALLKMRAELEIRAGRMRDALATVREIRERAPNDENAPAMEERIVSLMATDPTASSSANTEMVDALARVQTAVDAKDFVLARKMLADIRKVLGEDPRFDRFAIAIEVQAGDPERGRVLLQEALTRWPKDPALQRFNALYATNDPVERIVTLTDGTVEDPAMKPIVTYLRLLQSAIAVREAATRAKRLGEADAATTETAAMRLEQGVKEWRAKAEAADRTHPILVEADFRNAIEARDFAGATEVVRIARESKRDPAQAVLLESQLRAAQGQLRESIAVLEQAIQAGVDNSVVYRALGAALEETGNTEGAIRQYEESYKRRPADMQTVRLYVGALVRGGATQRALEVLREARQLAGFDEEITDVWLSLESRLGDRQLAQRLRENQYRVAPMDMKNALALINLLTATSPDRADVMNERGEPAYTEEQWAALDAMGRVNALERTRVAWRKRAEEVATTSLKREPGNLDVAAAYSNMLRILGRRADAVKVLSDAVAAAGEAAGWRGYAMLGNLQLSLEDNAAAEVAFAEAIRREDTNTREATRSVVDLLFAAEQYELAAKYLRPIVTPTADRPLKMRLAECELRAGNLKAARETFDAATAGATRDVGMEMLDGALLVAMADELRGAGKIAEAQTLYEQALAPYNRAKQLLPSAPQPFIQDAMLKRKLFELTGSTARGQEALAAADRAVALGASLMPASAIRAEVLLAVGDPNGAVGELERFLRISPGSIEARRRLTEIHERMGNLPRAEETVRAAASLMPGDPVWQVALGDILSRQAKYKEAAEAFQRADTLQHDPAVFFRELASRIRAQDYRGAVDASRRRPDVVRSSSTARTYVGLALIGGAERGDGLRTLGETYAEAKAAFASGDPMPLMQWYEAIGILFDATKRADAEALVKQFSGADVDVPGRIFLSTLCMQDPSGGVTKAIEWLAPVASVDHSAQPNVGAQALDQLGSFYYLNGSCQDAIAAFEKALKLAPNADGILNNYAYLCGDCLKDPKKGLPSSRLAVQLNPARSEYLDTLGSLLHLDGQNEEALDVLKRAAKLANGAAVQFHLAQVYKALGRTGEARDAAEQSLKMQADPTTKKSAEQLLSELK